MDKKTHIREVIDALRGDDVLQKLTDVDSDLNKLRTFLSRGYRTCADVFDALSAGKTPSKKQLDAFNKFLDGLDNYLDDGWPGNGGPIARN